MIQININNFVHMDLENILDFDFDPGVPKIIKVIGVGGGGGNAVTHMYRKGIHDVSFVLCNTDSQALKNSGVPTQIVLGTKTTGGLGAGNRPLIARAAAEESVEDIRRMLDDGTKMAFVTAGMGGGTGTGAAPVIAKIAKEMGILTVGIVTIPFLFEGKPKILQALNGVEEIARNVDALLVINNERLCEIYADLSMKNAFAKADDTLATAAKSIAEIITLEGIVNLDFADVFTTMKDGGVALMSNGFGTGEKRVRQALDEALNSPLLSNNDIRNARKILFNVYFSESSELRMDELADVREFMSKLNPNFELIWGAAIDNSLGDQIKIMIIATGFTTEAVDEGNMKKEHNKFLQTEEELRKAEELKKQEEAEKKLMQKYNVGYKQVNHTGRSLARPHVALLTDDELDDDAFIALMEENPSYNRDQRIITKARLKGEQTESKKTDCPVPSSPDQPGDNKPTIRFS